MENNKEKVGVYNMSTDLFIGLRQLSRPITEDVNKIEELSDKDKAYLNWYGISYIPDKIILNEDDEKFPQQVYIHKSSFTTVYTKVTLNEDYKYLKDLVCLIEAHQNSIIYLKVLMDKNVQSDYYRYVNDLHKSNYNEEQLKKSPSYLMSDNDKVKFNRLHRLPLYYTMNFSRISYLPEENPISTSLTDVPTMIKYSNILLDDFLDSKGIKTNSKFNN